MKTKVIYLLEYPIDLPGGAQMSTESLCEGLIPTEFEPIVICPELLKKKKEDFPFRIITYPMGEKTNSEPFAEAFVFLENSSKRKT